MQTTTSNIVSDMKRTFFGLSVIIWHFLFSQAAAQTLVECYEAAERNYPLIRQYDLISKTSELTVKNIGKGWLPQVSASAQATYQSDVMAWPGQMQTMLQTMGIDLKGLKKEQYKIGIDVQQMLYDGGAISSQKEIARQQGQLQLAQNDVMLYQVRQRVNEMYFALLLLEDRMRLNGDLQQLYASSEKKLESMYRNGTAAESDFLTVRAERLNVVQQNTELESQRQALQRMLSVFCGMEVNSEKISKPSLSAVGSSLSAGESSVPVSGSLQQRPELTVFDAQLSLANAQEKALDAALMPKLGIFAQGYYGYPGLNMFEDMMRHEMSLNGIIGARLSWSIGALYTRKNDKAKIELQREATENQRAVFLFNNNLEQIRQNENIGRYRKLMADDEEIIRLRSAVRKSAESKLQHGIIAVNDLVREINAENAAKVQQSVHEIEMLKEIYDLEYSKGK